MMIVTTATKLVGLIGMPLGQTLSPRLQNETYRDLGLDFFYFPIELPDFKNFPQLIAGLRIMNFGGLAVTKPYKVEIMKYLDDCEEITSMIGSCNTIKIEDGKWTGYNTDGVGALRSLRKEMGRDVRGLKFVSFGAGGSARSVCFNLAQAGAGGLVIADINEASFRLADEINQNFPGLAEAILVDDAAYQAKVRQSDVLLNLSGLGMTPHLDKTPIPQEWIEPRHICFEAVYNPAKTRFLTEAEQKGCLIINGMDMLIYQAVAQVEIWTGQNGSDAEESMQKSLMRILQESH